MLFRQAPRKSFQRHQGGKFYQLSDFLIFLDSQEIYLTRFWAKVVHCLFVVYASEIAQWSTFFWHSFEKHLQKDKKHGKY